MPDTRLIDTHEIDPNDIDISGRLRPVSEAAVASLIASIEELGLVKDEVIVRERRVRDGRHPLIAGAHRVVACARLNRWVPAKVYRCDDDWARLMEVDDNLAGGELTALDTAVFLAERKRVYERMHPEARRGFAGNRSSHGLLTDIVSVSSFANATAEKFGLSERHVFRLLQIGAALEPSEVALLQQGKRAARLADLQCLAKIGEPEERGFVVAALAEGRARGAAQGRALWKAEKGLAPPPASAVERAFKALEEAWSRAGKRVRRRFVEEHLDELQDLVHAAEVGDDHLHASLMAMVRDGAPGGGQTAPGADLEAGE